MDGRPVLALAHVVEAEAQALAHGQQPLEVRGAEPEEPAVDGPLGADQLGVALAVHRRRRPLAGTRRCAPARCGDR